MGGTGRSGSSSRSTSRERKKSRRERSSRRKSSSQHGISEVMAAIQSLKVSNENAIGAISNQLGVLSTNVDNKFQEVHTKIDDMDERINLLEQNKVPDGPWGSGPGDIAASSVLNPFAQPAPSVPHPISPWERIPDPNIVKVTTEGRIKVPFGGVEQVVFDYAREIGIPKEVISVTGNELGSVFVVKAGGLTPSDVVKDLLKRVKLPNGGGWRAFSTLDPNKNSVNLFLNPDKNNKQQKLEGATKRLTNLLKGKYPLLNLYGRRSEGIITCAYKKLAVLTASPDKVSVSWDPKILKSSGIEHTPIAKAFLEDENVQWCS